MPAKPSKIKLLPQEVKASLDQMLQAGQLTQKEILEIINKQTPNTPLSRSGLNRYAKQMEEVGTKIRQAREISQQWLDRLGQDSQQGEISRMAIEMVRAMIFDWTLKNEGEALKSKDLKELTVALLSLEKASRENLKREEQIRQAERERILEETQKAKARASDTDDPFELVRRAILCIEP